jgi:glycosyltransferase involved in cell wall biosynthesis
MDKSTCSVVIPVRNGADYITEAIESILRQTLKPAEIIVVNDGSTDNTAEILKQYGTKLKVTTSSGLGAPSARNFGVKAAKSQFIAFLDCDDIAHPDRLKKQLECLLANPEAGMVFCAMTYIDKNGQSNGGDVRCPEYNHNGFLGQLFERNRIGSTSVVMIRKKIFFDLGGFDEAFDYSEDYDLWLRVARDWKIYYLDETLLKYRLHDKNISHCREGHRLNELKALRKHKPETILLALKETYPTEDQAKLAYARLLFRMEMTENSREVVNELIFSGLKTPQLYFLLGNIHTVQGELKASEAAYQKCLSLSPDDAAAQNNLGVIFSQTGRHAEAASTFKNAIALKKNYDDPVHNAACLVRQAYTELKYTLVPLRDVLKPVN